MNDAMKVNLIKNATELKRLMDDPNVDTGDDPLAFAQKHFADKMPQAPQKPMNPLEANKKVLARYRSYFGD